MSTLALGLSLVAFGWLLLWRLRARTFGVSTAADAAFTAVLLFTTTSRVISPQYMLWLVGLAAVCLVLRESRMEWPAVLVVVATGVTQLEFPIGFVHVVSSDAHGLTLMFLRNGLLVAACVLAGTRLWQDTVRTPEAEAEAPAGTPDGTADGTPDDVPGGVVDKAAGAPVLSRADSADTAASAP